MADDAASSCTTTPTTPTTQGHLEKTLRHDFFHEEVDPIQASRAVRYDHMDPVLSFHASSSAAGSFSYFHRCLYAKVQKKNDAPFFFHGNSQIDFSALKH